MNPPSQLLTLDSNVLVAALKDDEHCNAKCIEILEKVPDKFLLAEPVSFIRKSVVRWQEKLGKQ
ncbi:MAG: hypothetical protein QXK91_05785 [Nitrososphaerales archaeon]